MDSESSDHESEEKHSPLIVSRSMRGNQPSFWKIDADGARVAAAAGSRSAARSAVPYYAIAEGIPHAGEDHHAAIAEAAYFRAERRGFRPGHELGDWLAAKAEIEGAAHPHRPLS